MEQLCTKNPLEEYHCWRFEEEQSHRQRKNVLHTTCVYLSKNDEVLIHLYISILS